MVESAKAVFLSCAPRGVEPARRVCEALRAAGLQVWFDQSELRGGDAALIARADGLSEAIAAGLSRFSYLRVIARSSTMRVTGDAFDVRTAGLEIAH